MKTCNECMTPNPEIAEICMKCTASLPVTQQQSSEEKSSENQIGDVIGNLVEGAVDLAGNALSATGDAACTAACAVGEVAGTVAEGALTVVGEILSGLGFKVSARVSCSIS